jgi:hypothetical protein
MSTQYPGGFITKSPVAPTSTAASGIWTVDQALQYVKAGTWPSPPIFIEDIFSTYLYTGNSSTQTITNGINLSGNGGLVWTKSRSVATDHALVDTVRGSSQVLHSESTAAQVTYADITSFNSTGYSLDSLSGWFNTSPRTYVSWTFRKQPKFFDIVTYTGDGTESRVIPHNLGSAPGCIIIKRTDSTSNWFTFHRSATENLYLNSTTAGVGGLFFIASANTTTFTLGTNTTSNASGGTYVAYLFAHNAGGFPANGGGSTNGITCGSFTATANMSVNLGYEPQWLMFKKSNTTSDWVILDNMRGWNYQESRQLKPNLSDAENGPLYCTPTATGFSSETGFDTGSTYIYVAIRRGPMKTPTVGTSVFATNLSSATGTVTYTTNFVTDTQLNLSRTTGDTNYIGARLIGTNYSDTKTTAAQSSRADWTWASNTTYSTNNFSAGDYVSYGFRRAPGFFDVVCYTGTGATATLAHNLGVVPEFIITKCRDTSGTWWMVYCSVLGANNFLSFTNNGTNGTQSGTLYPTTPTASSYFVSGSTDVGGSGQTYISYLYATLAGISKVGSYTGTAALQTIACGFTAGARFVLIKRTDSTGNWYVYDSTRGMASGNDPYLVMNGTAAFPENTTTNYVDTDTTGFKVTAAASTTVNISAATYIFLAIA